MDWFASQEKPVADQTPPRSDQTQAEPASVDQNITATPSESASLSNQDIDSLFAVEMPDWLSNLANPQRMQSPLQLVFLLSQVMNLRL